MIRTIITRTGPIGVRVLERNGRWRASLLGGHPSLARVDSAIARSADGAVANLGTAVEAALAPATMVNRLSDDVVPADG
jgi:cob(I)alamin adenosyltransferase